jgi:ribonucleoside-diphosphate reductase alpha chain
MKVTKRDGTTEPVMFDKITTRLKSLCDELDTRHVDPVKVAQKCVNAIYDGISTYRLDHLASEIAFSMYSEHPDYGKLAARVVVSDYHKRTSSDFYEVMLMLFENEDMRGETSPLVQSEIVEYALKFRKEIIETINHNADYNFGYFGFKTLERSYLMRINDVPIERPQHLFMRVAMQVHIKDWNLDKVFETYQLMSSGMYIHATPTLFNSGTVHPQLSSCFLHGIHDDSIEGIYNTNYDCAITSKWAGGVGCHIHSIRAEGSLIRGTNGLSTGIIPMLQVLNSTFRYVNQGGRRNGSCAIYIEPWHADIEAFLDIRKTHGDQGRRCLDLFTALWIPDLFMERVEKDETWSLFCPDMVKNLSLYYGDEFNQMYITAEERGLAKKTLPARDLFKQIITSQWETGTPYMLYKDSINRKSNQKNLGTIQCSNLCTEIVEFTSDEEMAVCNLASIVLPKFIKKGESNADSYFDFSLLYSVTKKVATNLDKIIDVNFYALDKAERSNKRHRPIGIGVQGLADCFMLLKLPFCSDKAKQLNRLIFETIYFASLTASNEIAKEKGPYSSFVGSPASKGILQFDMWGVVPSTKWDWEQLRTSILRHGLRNSLLVAPMPTASTASILGNNECFEPYTSNLYVRRVLSGEYVIMNEHLIRDLISLGLWNLDMKEVLIKNHGSIQNIGGIPPYIKELYKTVWEMKMRDIIDMAADRGAFIDQSQSLNLFVETPSFPKIYSMHMYAWKKGLKTGMYYLRTRAAADPIQFTVRNRPQRRETEYAEEECLVCSA